MAGTVRVMHDTNICDDCEQLFLEPEHLQILCSDFSLHNKENHTLSYRRKLQGLRANANQGCLLCTKLVNWFKLDSNLWEGFQLGLSEANPEDVVFAMCLLDIAPLVLSVSLEAAPENMGESNLLAFELLTASDDPAAQYFPGRLANHDVGTEQSFALAKRWMRECELSHPNCPKQRISTLPTRVLNLDTVDDPSGVRLCITEGSLGMYACLSYCWGSGFQPTQLTSANLPALLRRVPLQGLPQSIQDAIFTVRKLGLHYLWIDSLCIVQDSAEDKAREIERMDQIFRNANLTVSAANADDCSLGFLAKRDQWWSDADGPPIRLPFLCPDWTVGSISLVRYGNPARREPLYCRSWPFQEHLLSPRVLMYGSEQMLWVCQQDSPIGTGATFKDGGQAHDSSVTEMKYMRMFLHRHQVISPGFARRNLWIDLMIEYSPRKQSIPDDKIHALRGIASRYQRLMKDEYIAGLWKSWLLPGLLWKRSQGIQLRRKRQYPSWSWLSIDSAVTMERADDEVYRPESLINIQFVGYRADPLGNPLDPFGLLPNAVLHLRGCLRKVGTPDWKEMRLFSSDAVQSQTTFLRPPPARIVLDSIDVPASGSIPEGINGPMWCLPVTRARVEDQKAGRFVGYAVQGILLVKDAGMDSFRRIGWFISDIGDEARFLAGVQQDVYLR
ncbi:MAG: hypothetical protein Q9225_004286 [Loekoesia sp. 1 TL-2023]